jgi:hypothetical protein
LQQSTVPRDGTALPRSHGGHVSITGIRCRRDRNFAREYYS